MSWNQDKWSKFVSGNTKPVPSDLTKYIESTKELAKDHQEDIDTDALGIQRVKELLAERAAKEIGSRGPTGADGTSGSHNLTLITSNKQWYIGASPANILQHTFAAGELTGNNTLIQINCYMHNLSNVQIIWTTAGPIDHVIYYTGLPAGGLWGYMNIMIAQSSHPFDVGMARRSSVRSIGYYTNSVVTDIGANWMAVGGDLKVKFIPRTPTESWGMSAALYKLVF